MYSVQPNTGVLVLGTPQAKAETATANGEMPLDVLRTLLGVHKKERLFLFSLMKNPPCVLLGLYSTPIGRNADKMVKKNLPSLLLRSPVIY